MTIAAIHRKPAKLPAAAGISVPAFIHNGHYFFTEIDVYGDGLFECWCAVDRDFVARKIAEGWISPGAPAGQEVHVHNLFAATVKSCEWRHTSESLHKRLLESLSLLNEI